MTADLKTTGIDVCEVSKFVCIGEEKLHILNNISFSVTFGETVAILGASGSGKTTLLSLLAGLDRASSGQIYIAGHLLTDNEEQRAFIRSQWIGFVFQNFELLPYLTVLENVMLPLEVQNDSQAEEKAMYYIKQVKLEHRVQHYPKQLSGGEQQRVGIARAFSCQPKILMADEPTGNLDQRTGLHIIDLLFALNEKNNTTLIIVTHDKEIAERTKTCLLLDEGCLKI